MDLLRDRLKRYVLKAVQQCCAARGEEAEAEALDAAMDAIDRYAQHCAEAARADMADYCVAQFSGTPTLADDGKAVAP